ncbi:MAG: ATP-dependent Clp protease ATP-binding subunit ClpA, partial [Stutzerimonas stutzeri]
AAVFTARGAGAAPLHVEQHQQIFAARLARIVAQTELSRRLALFQQVDALAQRFGQRFKIEIAQMRLRLEVVRQHHAAGAAQINRQRRNRTGWQRLGGQADQCRPFLKPALSDGTLRLVGSTTYEEYRKYFEKDRALLRRFGKITVDEPSLEDARAIIHGIAPSYAEHHKVVYTAAALDAAVDLTHKYVTTGMLPDKAIDIIDMAGARLAVNDAKATNVLDVAEIEAEVSRVAKIPEHTIKDDETTKLANLEEDLRKVVYGQDAAITTLTDAVFIARSGLREEDKTQGSYLFTGPTGVGKTEVAKQLAATLGIPLLRFDMSEYMEKHSVAKLIGAPPGYVGFGEGDAGSGLLTNAVEHS